MKTGDATNKIVSGRQEIMEMYQTISDLNDCVEASHARPILILKHSVICPISAIAKSEVDKFLSERNSIPVFLVIVQRERPLSNEIAQHFDVGHESPQLLFIQNGRAVKVWNHSKIKAAAIQKELSKID